MKSNHMVTMGVAAAALVAGMLLAGAPARSVFVPLLVLACPLMMLFMMRGHDHGHAPGRHEDRHDARQSGDDPERRVTPDPKP